MAGLGNKQNGTFPKSPHLSPVQWLAHTHWTKLWVMNLDLDLTFGAGAPEKSPLLCLISSMWPEHPWKTSRRTQISYHQLMITPSSARSLTSFTCVTLWCLSLQVSKDVLYMSSYRLVLLMWDRVTQEQQVDLKAKIDPSLCYLPT